jgi:MFS family permease
VWGAVAAGGAAAGLLLGGVLTSGLGWEWNFFVNVPIGALAIALAPVLLTESRDRAAPRLDLAGTVTVTAGLGLLVYGLSRAESAGLGSTRTLGILALAVVLVAAFRLIEGRVANPLVRFDIFRSRTLVGANLVALVSAAVIGGQGFFSTLYLQQVLGYSPLVTGFALLPMTFTIMVVSTLGSRLVNRVGTKPMMVAGMAFLTVGMLLLARIPVDGSYLTDLLPGFLLFALGLGFTFVTAIIAGTSGVSDEEQGLASGLVNTSQQIGNALGLAILVAVAAIGADALGGGRSAEVLVGGYRWAFLAGAGLQDAAALEAATRSYESYLETVS